MVALVAVTNPELFRQETVAADVETAGEITAGMLVIDRRHTRDGSQISIFSLIATQPP